MLRRKAFGIRTSKKVGSTTTDFTLDGTKIIRSQKGTVVLYFYYDESGSPIGMKLNGTNHYFVKNIQGDVIALVNESGTVTATYKYDAWGNLLSYTGGGAALANPFRYRSYYYDIETGLYYVSSRYYDPETCRFINADTTDVLDLPYHNANQYNLFAYCNNNPVNDRDDDGQLSWLAKIAIGVGAVALGAIVVAATGGTAAAFIPAVAAGVKAAAISGAIGAAVGAGTSAVSHRVSTGSWKGVGKAAIRGAADGFADGFMAGGITAGAGMAIGALGKTASGIQIGKTAKPQYGKVNAGYGTPKTNGNTLLSIQNNAGKRVFSLDFDSVHAVHMHLPKILPNVHIPIGSIISGTYGGMRKW